MLRLLLVVTTVFSCFSFAEAPFLDFLRTAQLQAISTRDSTAVIKLNNQLHIAKQNNVIFGHFRVRQVHQKHILIESDDVIVRLFLDPPDSKSKTPPEIFYRHQNEQDTYHAIPLNNNETLKGAIK